MCGYLTARSLEGVRDVGVRTDMGVHRDLGMAKNMGTDIGIGTGMHTDLSMAMEMGTDMGMETDADLGIGIGMAGSPPPRQNVYTIRPAAPSDLRYLPDVERSAATLFRSDPTLAVLADDEPMSVERHRASLEKWNGMGVGGGGTWVAVAESVGASSGGVSVLCEEGGRERDASIFQVEDAGAGAGAGCCGRGRDEGLRLELELVREGVVGFIMTSLVPVMREWSASRFMDGFRSDIAVSAGVDSVRNGGCEGDESGGIGGNVHEYHETEESGAKLYFLHIDELSVHAGHQRKGLASRLLRAARDCVERLQSSQMKVLGISLTTMRDVPFNAPFYERFGFKEIEHERIGETLGREGGRAWTSDQGHFALVGDGKLARRRCFMLCEA